MAEKKERKKNQRGTKSHHNETNTNILKTNVLCLFSSHVLSLLCSSPHSSSKPALFMPIMTFMLLIFRIISLILCHLTQLITPFSLTQLCTYVAGHHCIPLSSYFNWFLISLFCSFSALLMENHRDPIFFLGNLILSQ